MSVAIRIDDKLYNEAKSIAQAEFRSVPEQIQYWAVVGKCALDNPELPISLIKELIYTKRQSLDLAEPFEFE